MPKVPVGSQIFDVAFHPTHATVYTGLLNGYIKAFAYDEQGNHQPVFSLLPSKKSCRGLCLDLDGSHLYAVGKGKSLSTIDTTTEALDVRRKAHDSAINRVKHLIPWLLATGDDDGIIKLWDPRKKDSVRSYTQHFDYITDFLWLEDNKQLLATSGDGTLSVMDVRSKKILPVGHSEDQEDELLSVVAIKGAAKVVVGTQLGILSVFNRDSGWGDCVDRIPGHPLSVDALCPLPVEFPDADMQSTVLTGSSDGLVRAVRILPTKLLGVVADHGEWAVERVSIGGGGLQAQNTIDQPEAGSEKRDSGKIGMMRRTSEVDDADDYPPNLPRRWWVGSGGHDEVLHLTNLEAFFRHHENENEGPDSVDRFGVTVANDDHDDRPIGDVGPPIGLGGGKQGSADHEAVQEGKIEDSPPVPRKKRKRQIEKEAASTAPPRTGSKNSKKGKKNAIVVEGSFFDGL